MGEASTPTINGLPPLTTTTLEFPQILIGKNILLATESYGPINGVSKTTQQLVTYLRSHGVNIAIVAPEIHSTNPQRKNPTISSPNTPSKEIEIRVKGYPLPYDPTLSVVYPVRLSTLYAKTFGKKKPDLIYLASPASLGFQILLQHRLSHPSSSHHPSSTQHTSSIPILLNFQTDLSAYCSILFPSPLSTWATLVFHHVQGYLFTHPSVIRIFYPSTGVHTYLLNTGVPAQKMINLRRGVDGTLFSPSKRDERYRESVAGEKEIILLSVCRIAGEKGFDFLAEVAGELERRGVRYKLLIVGGNGNPEVVSEIQGLFGGLLEKGKVVFTGMLGGEALARVYASADLFLHCSVTETFGLVVLESMASGVPVVARDEGGPSDIVVDGESGYLVSPGDLEGFVERVVELGRDGRLRGRMGRRSREMAEGATWEGIGNKVAWEMAGVLEEEVGKGLGEVESRSSVGKGIETLWEICGMGIIVGVWGGLVVTWGLVKVSLGVKGMLSRIKRVFGWK